MEIVVGYTVRILCFDKSFKSNSTQKHSTPCDSDSVTLMRRKIEVLLAKQAINANNASVLGAFSNVTTTGWLKHDLMKAST